MGKKDGRLLSLETEILKPFYDPALHLLRRHALGQVQIASQDLQDGAVGDRTPVCGARGLELDHAVFLDPPQEFIEQARLARAWFTRQ